MPSPFAFFCVAAEYITRKLAYTDRYVWSFTAVEKIRIVGITLARESSDFRILTHFLFALSLPPTCIIIAYKQWYLA